MIRGDLIIFFNLVNDNIFNMDQISRREFNSRLAKIGLGMAAAGIFPSCQGLKQKKYPEGKFLDAHHHIGQDLLTRTAPFTLDPIIHWMDQHSVSQTILLSAVEYPQSYYIGRGEPVFSHEKLLDKVQETDGRILPFCTVHQDAFDSSQEITGILKRFRKKGVIGFGELKPRDKGWNPGYLPLDDPAMKRIYTACAEVGFPVLLHIDNRHALDTPGLPALERVLREFSEVVFIGHANGWWNSLSGDVTEFGGYPEGKITAGGAAVRLLEEYPNMYADLSANSGLNAITRDPVFGIPFIINHADKLLFGTDAQGGTGRESHFEFYNRIDLPQEVKNKIFRDNTRKILNI
jgi:predicted TIM-barrel fold metal-dependent hydrolase